MPAAPQVVGRRQPLPAAPCQWVAQAGSVVWYELLPPTAAPIACRRCSLPPVPRLASASSGWWCGCNVWPLRWGVGVPTVVGFAMSPTGYPAELLPKGDEQLTHCRVSLLFQYFHLVSPGHSA